MEFLMMTSSLTSLVNKGIFRHLMDLVSKLLNEAIVLRRMSP
jgi:hypothetical protein